MITFSDLTKQVHLLKNLILSDMVCGTENEDKDETQVFTKNISLMKNWFLRISWANKKRYLLALLDDVQSAWTLSCVLKSIWNCQPKDAIISTHQGTAWSSYDSVPIDHNRTALPVSTLAQVMKNGRFWFLSLEPQAQATVLLELLSLSGGPIMSIVLKCTQSLYENYRKEQLLSIQDCIMLNESPEISKRHKDKHKSTLKESSSNLKPNAGQRESQKELESNLLHWNNTLKEMQDSLKLEELEITFKNGINKKIWKVNRPKPEALETVDQIQLLPSEIGLKILSYLPKSNLLDYARVNKYWAYLVQRYQNEFITQQKLKEDFKTLENLMLTHDLSLDFIGPIPQALKPASLGIASIYAPSARVKQAQAMSIRASEKSAGAYSFRHLVGDHLSKPIAAMKPISNIVELSERLDERGAADENLWNWCNNIIQNPKLRKIKRPTKCVIPQGSVHFPLSIIRETLEIPLKIPLIKDPATNAESNRIKNISNTTLIFKPKQPKMQRYHLWTKDFTGLYPVYKIPSHAYPI